ncbi:MAG: DUF493 domain-containing protein [Pseudomonadales bacterium]|nr:DUF493 domain-containing protein [Pseudomonadales bacterium]MDG1662052.1 DUF493 domain-containing protein [Pseudomonadales bacterium]MDG2079832.1 DUF493 domain-containing protein [Pseudomonadales bacterium]
MSKLISDKTLAPDQDAAKIIFPCQYPIKILGSASVDFEVRVLEVVAEHASNFDSSTISRRDSNKGSFRSITVTITATGEQQLDTLHRALLKIEQVKMVL